MRWFLLCVALVGCKELDPAYCAADGDPRCPPCVHHEDCDSRACLPNGLCAGADEVAYVDPAATSDQEPCPQASPCKTFAPALRAGLPYVKLHGMYTGALTVVRDVVIVADPGAEVISNAGGFVMSFAGARVEVSDVTIHGSPTMNFADIQVGSFANVTLDRVSVTGSTSSGINVYRASLTIRHSTIEGSAGQGVNSSDTALVVVASTIRDNAGGGIVVPDGSFNITNSFFYGNGSNTSDYGAAGLTASSGAPSSFDFNTVVDNHAKTGRAGGVLCNHAGGMVRNNLIVRNYSGGDAIQADSNARGDCDFLRSFVAPTLDGLAFVDPASHDYHLSAGSVAIDKAMAPSPVTDDFDGDPRPEGKRDLGADEYVPGRSRSTQHAAPSGLARSRGLREDGANALDRAVRGADGL